MVQMLARLPNVLRVSWLLLVLGLVGLWLGYLRSAPWQSGLGLACWLGGYLVAGLDLWLRKTNREKAVGFHMALLTSWLVGLILLAVLLVVAAFVILIDGLINGFSTGSVLRILHFVGILLVTLTVVAMPDLTLRGWEKEREAGDSEGIPS